MEEFEEEMPVGMRFSIISRAIRRQMDELLRDYDLTGPQLGILGRLHYLEAHGKQEINQRDLEKATHLSHTTVTEMIKRLESKNFIKVVPSSIDRRSRCISSTGRADALHEGLDRCDKEAFERLCEGLTEEQIDSAMQTIDVMLANAIKIIGKGSMEEE